MPITIKGKLNSFTFISVENLFAKSTFYDRDLKYRHFTNIKFYFKNNFSF